MKGMRPRKIRRLSQKKQILLLKNLRTLVSSNLTQKEIAQRLVEFGTKEEQSLGHAVLASLNVGGTFAMAAKPWFSPMAWEALIAGEKTGVLEKGIKNALKILEIGNVTGMGFFWGLLKPIGTVIVMFAALIGAREAFFPKIMDLYSISRWGDVSIAAYNFGGFLSDWWKLILCIILSLIAIVIFTIKYSVGMFRNKLDKFPVYRHYRLILSANFLRSIGNLILAGFSLKESLSSTKEQSNLYLSYHIDIVMKNIGRGYLNIGEILDTGLLDRSEQSALKVLGGRGGNLSQTLLNCSEITQDKVVNELSNLQKILYNILMPIGGLLSFLLMGGVGMLMFDLSTNIG
ncbi:hypothetical protein ABT56_18845 [Photobacterium aquae]|uniref:Type II secretion system protein GspF domain-containing protein n=1 Tax=Photobacterium aquae TaxID=1195763 RepID=A0A0J1GUS9_9GAMM|nr:type II secretion system F family protein [Photobacterium aquae]KLV03495.1 hypothetical protein ABT56_18845 [Photobacterium aquae]